MPCPDDATALRFVQGQLVTSERRTIESHLDTCPRCYSAITELARVFASEIAPKSDVAYADTELHGSGVRHRDDALATPSRGALEPGTRFGRYEIRWCIGAGGMGTVYAAYDQLLARLVALKVLSREALAGLDAERFVLSEARAASALAHPNLVVIYDVGSIPEGDASLVYIAMELVAGASFGRWRAAAARSQGELIATLGQAGAGLAAMHDRGLVHRDIKPDNLLVGEDGRVRVTDFGLVAGAGGPTDGLLVGTPAYMSPEQLFLRPVDPRSDQFSFAVVVHEALTGVRPFQGRSVEELRWAVTSGARIHAPGLPRALREVLDTALAVDPSRRFSSMRVFLDKLAASTRAGDDVHVRINSGLSWAMAILHLALTFVGASSMLGPSASSPSSESDGDSGGLDGGLIYGAAAVLIVSALITLFWLPAGLVWAPINAWGLRKRRAWARVSTLVYAALGLFTCFGTPYSVYAIYSLTRPRVKRLFSDEGTT